MRLDMNKNIFFIALPLLLASCGAGQGQQNPLVIPPVLNNKQTVEHNNNVQPIKLPAEPKDAKAN